MYILNYMYMWQQINHPYSYSLCLLYYPVPMLLCLIFIPLLLCLLYYPVPALQPPAFSSACSTPPACSTYY